MKCTKCGFENEENSRFCQSCGASFEAVEAEKTEEVAQEAPAKKCCGLLKNKAALIGLGALVAFVLLLVIVISAIANSGNGFIERECEYEIIQNEEGDLVVLSGKKLIKDKIDIETPEEADWEMMTSLDGSVALVLVEDVDGEDDVNTLYVIKKNKITKVADVEDDDAMISVNGDVVLYNEIDEENETSTLICYTVKNGKTKEIFKSDEEKSISRYAVSPDGKTVVYTVNELEEEGDGEVKHVTYIYNGKKSEKIMTSDVMVIAVSNKAKYIYGAVQEEKEEGTDTILYIYNKKGEKETKLGNVSGNIMFNADCTQAVYTTRNDKGDTYSYLTINGKEGVKLAKTALYMIATGIDANVYYGGSVPVYPVEDLYDHVFMGVKYDEEYKATYDAYLVKKGEDKTVKLVSGINTKFTLDKDAEYLYYMEADDDDNTLKVLKIAKGEKAKDKAKTIAEDVEKYVLTSDRKTVFFIDEDDSLCKVNGKKGGKSKTIASDVVGSLYISEKDVVYYANEDEELCATTGGKGKKIMDDCYDVMVINGQIFVENEDHEICFVNKTKKPKKLVTEYVVKEAAPEAPNYGDEGIG